MIAIEKQRTGPDVDRLGVVGGEVVVQARDEQAFDFGVALGASVCRRRYGVEIRAERVGHSTDVDLSD
jgi:hypothetical protein